MRGDVTPLNEGVKGFGTTVLKSKYLNSDNTIGSKIKIKICFDVNNGTSLNGTKNPTLKT